MKRAKKAAKTEATLDTFRTDLLEYEALILKKHEVTNTLVTIELQLTTLRTRLFNKKALATASETAPGKNGASKLDAQDPRVRKSVGALLAALKQLNGEAHISDLSKALGISNKAAWLRCARGEKLGILKHSGKGTYKLRS